MMISNTTLSFLATVCLLMGLAMSRLAPDPPKVEVGWVEVRARPESEPVLEGDVDGGKLIQAEGTTGPPAQGSLKSDDGMVNGKGAMGPTQSGSMNVGKTQLKGALSPEQSGSVESGSVNGGGKVGSPKTASHGCVNVKPNVVSCGKVALAPGSVEGTTSIGDKAKVLSIAKTPIPTSVPPVPAS